MKEKQLKKVGIKYYKFRGLSNIIGGIITIILGTAIIYGIILSINNRIIFGLVIYFMGIVQIYLGYINLNNAKRISKGKPPILSFKFSDGFFYHILSKKNKSK